MPGKARYSPGAFNLAETDLPVKYPGVVKIAAEKLANLHSLWPYLDLKGRRWLSKLLEEQGQAPMNEELPSGNEDDPDDPTNDTMEYMAALLLNPRPAVSGTD